MHFECFVCFIGFQTTIPYCVRQSDKATVANEYCEASEKPTVITKSCNEKACPKVYEYKAVFKKCSVTCAKGLFFFRLFTRNLFKEILNASLIHYF